MWCGHSLLTRGGGGVVTKHIAGAGTGGAGWGEQSDNFIVLDAAS
jgi:hypothetical protein